MKIGLLNVDCNKYPNIALGKIAAYHRLHGDSVEWADAMFGDYDRVYASKIFTFSPDISEAFRCEILRGGTGYDLKSRLPEEIDRLQPDYSIFPDLDARTAYGFLTRGCPNKCPWCVVPKKEGAIRPYMDVEEIACEGRTRLILMDNNILAAGEYAKIQFEKIIRNGYRIDFNQAMDSRLVDSDFASMMARMRWIDYIRFGCDTPAQIHTCEEAINLLRSHGFKGRFFLYCLLTSDFNESFNRIDHWHRKADWAIHPFAMPYRDPFVKSPLPGGTLTSQGGATEKNSTSQQNSATSPREETLSVVRTSIPQWQRDLAKWTNKHALYEACEFRDFQPRSGFRCERYIQLYT